MTAADVRRLRRITSPSRWTKLGCYCCLVCGVSKTCSPYTSFSLPSSLPSSPRRTADWLRSRLRDQLRGPRCECAGPAHPFDWPESGLPGGDGGCRPGLPSSHGVLQRPPRSNSRGPRQTGGRHATRRPTRTMENKPATAPQHSRRAEPPVYCTSTEPCRTRQVTGAGRGSGRACTPVVACAR